MGSTRAQVLEEHKICQHYWEDCDLDRFADEMPRHRVESGAFWIDQTEIRNAQYRLCVEAGACEEPACWGGGQFNQPQQPVVCVTWQQAADYCGWVGGALPNEVQWEYAARGPHNLRFPWGNFFQGDRLNYCDATCGRPRSDPAWNDSQLYSASVGSYPTGVSWCGALDMAGNVSEWVADGYAPYPSIQPENQPEIIHGAAKVVRGGSWFMSPAEVHSAWRQGIPPDSWFDDLGFRCVMSDQEN